MLKFIIAVLGLVAAPYPQAPAWVGSLPQSSITTISLNNPDDTMPAALVNEVNGWDVSYSGYAFAPDYSTHGALLASGGGGYVADIYCAAAFDMATRKWVPVWTERPPLTWADGSEFSFNPADMPPDATVFPSNTGKGTVYYFKPQGTTTWDSWWLYTSNPFRTGETALHVPMAAHEYNGLLGLPAGTLGTGEYGGLLLGMRTFATVNGGLCSMYPFVLDLKTASRAPANRSAWQRLSEIPFPPGGIFSENKPFGNNNHGITTSFDYTRKRALISWAAGGRGTAAVNMSGGAGSESYAWMGIDDASQLFPYGCARLMGNTDIRVIASTESSTVKVYCVNLDPAVTASVRRIVPITNISGTAPGVGGNNGFAGLSFDWVADAYGGEGAFAFFTVGSPWPKALYWLKPPVNRSAWQTGQWMWECEDLTGDTPIPLASECWGRFYWAPKCGVGVWCGDSRTGVQAIRSSRVSGTTGICVRPDPAASAIVVRPNPFRERVIVDAISAGIGADASLSLYTITGKLVRRATGARADWDAGDLAPGIYVINARGLNKALVKSVVSVK